MSLQKMVGRGMNKDLRKSVNLEVDGKHIDLPNIKGIIILNIMRYAAFYYEIKIELNQCFNHNYRIISPINE